MNRISVWFIRMSLFWFLLAVFSGGCLLLNQAGYLTITVHSWLGVHITLAVMGWMAGVVAGTGLWMLPRWIRPDGIHSRMDRWWQFALCQLGVASSAWMWSMGWNPLVGVVIWAIGMGSLLPVFWLRSRPVPEM